MPFPAWANGQSLVGLFIGGLRAQLRPESSAFGAGFQLSYLFRAISRGFASSFDWDAPLALQSPDIHLSFKADWN
jgi:hypothetical protein